MSSPGPQRGIQGGHGVRVLTWNLHGWVGRGGRRDPGRTLAALGHAPFDIAAFQEVEVRAEDAWLERRARTMQGWHLRAAWAIETGGRRYGQVIASRFPVTSFRVHDISLPDREPRRVLDARCDTPWGDVRVIAAHLGLAAAERRAQAGWLSEIALHDPGLPTLLCGDFNEWRRSGPVSRILAGLFEEAAAPVSFPARFPTLPLDRIYLRGGRGLSGIRTVREAAAASDHLPLRADAAF